MAVSMSGIKIALGSASNSLRAYSVQAGFTIPDRMSEFTGYGPPPPPPPPPPTVWQIELCSAEAGYPRTEYVTLNVAYTGPFSVGRIYKFSDSYLGSGIVCWSVVNTGGSITFSSVTPTTEYVDCATCTGGGPPAPPPPPPPPPPAATGG